MQCYFNPSEADWDALTERPTASYESLEPLVAAVFDSVKTRGDQAVIQYTAEFDGMQLSDFSVTEAECKKAESGVSEALKKAIQQAKNNIEQFHSAQRTDPIKVTTQTGVACWQEKKPIEKVGLYIPGGTAPLFSTVLMLAVPAQIAECKEIVLCSPPNKEGKIASEILYTAKLCGVTKIMTVGGIQAIAGLTFGTETIPKVH